MLAATRPSPPGSAPARVSRPRGPAPVPRSNPPLSLPRSPAGRLRPRSPPPRSLWPRSPTPKLRSYPDRPDPLGRSLRPRSVVVTGSCSRGVPTTSIRPGVVDLVRDGRTETIEIPSTSKSASTRSTSPTRGESGRSFVGTTPRGSRAPAARQVQVPSSRLLVNSMSIRRDMITVKLQRRGGRHVTAPFRDGPGVRRGGGQSVNHEPAQGWIQPPKRARGANGWEYPYLIES